MHLVDPSFREALSDRYLLLRDLGAGGMATVYLPVNGIYEVERVCLVTVLLNLRRSA